jgi:hypothetical protein
VVVADRGDDRLVVDQLTLDAGRSRTTHADDRCVEVSCPQVVEELIGVRLGQSDLHRRMIVVELRQEAGQVDGVRGHGPDGDVSPEQSGQLVDSEPGTFDRGECGLRVRENGRPYLGQPHRTAGPARPEPHSERSICRPLAPEARAPLRRQSSSDRSRPKLTEEPVATP